MLVGREKEIQSLKEAYNSDKSEFVAIYGRRRIGKTYLVNEVFAGKILFHHAGLSKGSMTEQLDGWRSSLRDAGVRDAIKPSTWIEAFDYLKDLIRSSRRHKKVIFIDEIPWLDTPRSNFLSAFEFFWNGWVSARKDVLLIICGSATSWVINKVIKNHGGLHDRVTYPIALPPFCLHECELLIKANGMVLTRQQILEGYMVMGGVPYYWSMLRKGKSMAGNIDDLFFSHTGKLRHEFDDLYDSLFRNPEPYIKVVDILGNKKSGMTRKEIVETGNWQSNGNMTRILEDLEYCGFIRKYQEMGKETKGAIYQLMDNYSLFYYQFVRNNKDGDEHFWSKSVNKPVYNAWTGLAFERVCFQHIPQIKRALGFSAVTTNVYAWQVGADKTYGAGAQIDMLIDRQDNTVNLCEIKYSSSRFAISQQYSETLRHKVERFAQATGTKKAVLLTMITSNGLLHNAYAGDVQNEVVADDLFAAY